MKHTEKTYEHAVTALFLYNLIHLKYEFRLNSYDVLRTFSAVFQVTTNMAGSQQCRIFLIFSMSLSCKMGWLRCCATNR